ncbi:hypothetical protein IFM89_036762 [Coptis chinensis]|uniref:SWIM-type domain-containing protein n=1 Tax=Coptis chinensis TaxID=261450 RepID=A0A835LU74_9MAGN|nr:hypothetical protein IFM89_036762 [Coptis chinensis]
MTYDVKFIRSKTNEEGEHWIVKWNQQMCEGVCECHLYEFVGIPCAHILKAVLDSPGQTKDYGLVAFSSTVAAKA